MQEVLKSGKKRKLLIFDNGARSRNRTGTTVKSRDFKSLASTNFAIRAEILDVLRRLFSYQTIYNILRFDGR